MKLIAEKRELMLDDNCCATASTMYEVRDGETVEELFRRMGMTGATQWQYSQLEVRLKLAVEK